MPYIKQEIRDRIAKGGQPNTAGELTYVLTKVILDYLPKGKISFEDLNTVIGALKMAEAEFQHRVVRWYETKKWEQNGDVYQKTVENVTYNS